MQPVAATPGRERLSCDRCRIQKLRCPRGGSADVKSCSRCQRRGAECIYSTPLPKGRPRANRPASMSRRGAEPTWPSSPRTNDSGEDLASTTTSASTSISSSISEGSLGAGVGLCAKDIDGSTARLPQQQQQLDYFATSTFSDSNRIPHRADTALFSQNSGSNTLAAWLPQSTTLLQDTRQPATRSSPPPVFLEPLDIAGVAPSAAGYIRPGNASRPRYVESTFWALVHGQEPSYNEFLDAIHRNPSRSKKHGHGDGTGILQLLQDLPTKAVCDLFLYSFIVGVRPVYPLIHLPTFRTDYNAFWHWYTYEYSDTLTQDQLFADATFIPLLFAVLYAGAVAAPANFWAGAQPLAGLAVDTTVDKLRTSYRKGLDYCQYMRFPTVNTLVASLLSRGCSNPDDEALEDQAFINVVVRTARSIGLHREHVLAGLDPPTRETYRRIWWHVVYLDTQYSLRYGSQTCCGPEGDQWDVQMVSEASDEAIGDFADLRPQFFGSMPSSMRPTRTTSIFMLFVLGRYETTRFMHKLLVRVNSCQRFNQDDLNMLFDAFKTLQIKINALINRMPTQGAPEKGLVPFRLANASILTHESLYSDQSEEPSVFISWARITLTMLLKGCLLGLKKLFLGHPHLTAEHKLWTSAFRLSNDFIRHLLHIIRVPAFAPYLWFFTTDISTFQAILVILSYLKHNPSIPDAQNACYFVDEALEILETLTLRSSVAVQITEDPRRPPKMSKEPSAVWLLLKTLRMNLDMSTMQTPAKPYNLQTIMSSINVSGSNERGSTGGVSTGASVSQQPQHASTASLFGPSSGQLTPEKSSRASFSTDELSLGFDLGSFSPYLGSDADGNALAWELEGALELPDLDSWSSMVL